MVVYQKAPQAIQLDISMDLLRKITVAIKGDLYGLEKYWAFHHFRKQDSTPISKHAELERLLREEFRTIEDFKAQRAADKGTVGSSSKSAVAASHNNAEAK
ncbi:hypothetical protein ZWY2020_033876 [Hordeum vulgare]|nr:hypothetical protein ZWY2020_033876 [Hordeum vulgare]